MPGVGRVRRDLVGGTGVITGPGASTVLVNGVPVSTVGDTAAAHGESPHSNPVITSGSNSVKADGRNITLEGISQASCGHAVTSGSNNVRAT